MTLLAKFTQKLGKLFRRKKKEKMGNNQVKSMEGFKISYSPITLGKPPKAGMEGQTALIHKDKYFVLYGDHRKQYEELVDYQLCYEYFKSNSELMTMWSSPLEPTTSDTFATTPSVSTQQTTDTDNDSDTSVSYETED
jgi:hypothetical protein